MKARKVFRVMDNSAMVGTFAIAYKDEVVWGTGNARAFEWIRQREAANSLHILNKRALWSLTGM